MDDLKVKLENISRRILTIRDTDPSVDQLQQAMVLSYYLNCPAWTTRSPRMAPWWNKILSGIRAKTRRLFNKSKKEIRKTKGFSWRRYCQEINDVSYQAASNS
jgi:hypothetical protein